MNGDKSIEAGSSPKRGIFPHSQRGLPEGRLGGATGRAEFIGGLYFGF